MKYALLVYSTPGSHDLPEAEFAAVMRDYEAVREQPGFVASAQLHAPDMATTLRAADGGTLTTDGPFADTKEVFGGYYVFDVADLDTALEIARGIPALRLGGAVEVRPVIGGVEP
jgi:hypothetical protein